MRGITFHRTVLHSQDGNFRQDSTGQSWKYGGGRTPIASWELSAEEYHIFKEEICKEFEETYDEWVAKVPSIRKAIKMRFDKSSFPSYEAVSQGLYSLNMLPLINRLNLTEEGKMAEGTERYLDTGLSYSILSNGRLTNRV
jgi:hypothetical protein